MNEPPSHFDHLIWNPEEEARQEAEQRPALKPGQLRQEDFRTLFVKGFGGASMLTGLKSLKLPNSHVDLDAAHAASDAIYETILDIPALHFLLSPGNKWFERAFVIGLFGVGMRQAVIAEAIERRKDQAQKPDFSKAKRAAQKSEKNRQDNQGHPTPEQAAALTGG